MRSSFVIGSAVRDNHGIVGRVVRVPRHLRMRGYVPVVFDGAASDLPVLVRQSLLSAVAHRYEDWKRWEAAKAAGQVASKF